MRITFTLCLLLIIGSLQAQLLTWTPDFIQENSAPVEIFVDATKGNQGLRNYTPTSDVYVHIAVITTLSANSSDWKYNKFTWGTTNPSAQATYVSANKWKYTITGGLRNYFGISNSSEKILKIALLFRNGSGSQAQRNADGSDMYIPVYEPGLAVRITAPLTQPKFSPEAEPLTVKVGDALPVSAKSSETASLKLYLNGAQFATNSNNTSIDGNAVISSAGSQVLVAEANVAGTFKYDTVRFTATNNTVVEPLPAGVTDGINYDPNGTAATLVLYAPGKSNIAVIGEFNGWSPTSPYQMKRTPDGLRFWVTLTGLTSGAEYAYQYLIEGSLKVADYNAEKVLDPNNDRFIPAANYPNLKAYPTGFATGIVSVLQPGKATYTWQINNFVRPNKGNLLIYELLLRDFVATQNWQTLKDTLAYIKRLGINTIEVMPFNEFEGNNSWGYNPSFFFAPDKMYGTETALKQFIDECHKQGIAVVMDMVMNHAFGQSPTAQMYWNSALNRPADDNPWHNPIAKHPANVGYDFNHESQATKELVDRVVKHWLTKYKLDGFRWDLSKGFTQTNYCVTQTCDQSSDFNSWSQYDAARIATWKRIYDTMQAVSTSSYCILEHFGGNSEEKELADYGMLLWGNSNYNYNEATMGYVSTSNFQSGIYTNRGWTSPNLITYQESHDEERLMYKNLQFGNSSGGYNTRDLNTALKRNEMAAAFWAMTPAPKMLWQFGELGYDYSINNCENGTISNDCRLSPKPIRWDYYNNANRKALYDVYSKLLWLRRVPNFLPTFLSNNINYNLSGGFKTLQITSDSLKITVIGNFDVNASTGSVTFQEAGMWYNYLDGGSRMATGNSESITLQPGEYAVFLNKPVNTFLNALPVKLISFSGKRNASNIALLWNTSNEINVKHYELQRSFDGAVFTTLGTTVSNNRSVLQRYSYSDVSADALHANDMLYYRLKMVDNDGSKTFSNIVAINPNKSATNIKIYPNPVKGGVLNFSVDAPNAATLNATIEDISGRIWKTYTYRNSGTSQRLIANIQTLTPGTYLLKIETNKFNGVQKFVVQ